MAMVVVVAVLGFAAARFGLGRDGAAGARGLRRGRCLAGGVLREEDVPFARA